MVPKKCDANHVNNINNIPYYIIIIIVLLSAAGILCGYPQWLLLPHSHKAPIRNPYSSWEVYGPGVPSGNQSCQAGKSSVFPSFFFVFSWENWQKINGGLSHGADDTSDGIPKCVDDLSPFSRHEIPMRSRHEITVIFIAGSTSAGDQPCSGDLAMSKARQVWHCNSPTWRWDSGGLIHEKWWLDPWKMP